MMYWEARDYLNQITKYGSVLGLESIKELLRRLNNPQNDLKFVHVAGTNGKGSTVAFVSTILQNAGYKTGRYTSPSVFSYREKMQINEECISKEELARLTFQVKEVIDDMVQEGLPHPTVFEVETAIAFLYFKEEACDIVVLETGLGGSLDATNIVENTLVAALTSISKDHMEYLGNTIEEIAKNKAGIIKKDSIVVSIKQEDSAMDAIRKKCNENNNTLIIADKKKASDIRYDELTAFNYKELKDIKLGVFGSYQIENAILSLEVAMALNEKGFTITNENILEGLSKAKWPGRFSVICKNPTIFIDGAHNEAAAYQLKDTIETYFPNKKLMFIIGVFADKEYEKIVKITAPLANQILAITIPNNPRALEGEILTKVIRKYNSNVKCMLSLEEAARECLKSNHDIDAVIVFGSLSYLGEFVNLVKKIH